MVVALPVLKIRIGGRAALGRRRFFEENEEAAGVGKGKRVEQDSVDDGEDSSVGANAEGEGREDNGRESEIFS